MTCMITRGVIRLNNHVSFRLHLSRMSKGVSNANIHKPTLTLYTKDVCPLCDKAMHDIKPALNKVNMEKIDITAEGNEEWFDLYQYDIPVFHLNGSFLMMHKGDLQLLNNALENLRKIQKHVYKLV